MSQAVTAVLPCFATVRAAAAAKPPRQKQNLKTQKSGGGAKKNATSKVGFGGKKNDPLWQCVKGCGACCKLDKGPTFPSPEEIFDDPSDAELCRSLIGSDGWCKHFEKGTRTCSIYADRPYFCRVDPDTFETLYGIDKKKFNKEACSCCIDTIKAVYGSQSEELDNFNRAIWRSTAKFKLYATGLYIAERLRLIEGLEVGNIITHHSSLMPHYFIYEFSEPKFVEYESCHHTWYDDSYGSGALYGEPISPYQHDFFYEPSSLAYPEEVDFMGRFWNEYGIIDQACKELPLQLPYNGNSNWLGEYASYFDGHWVEDISHEYGAFDYKFGEHGNSLDLEKAEDTYRGDERYDYCYSYDDSREERPAHDYNSWFGNGFTLRYEAYEEGTREYEPPLHSHNVYEMRLCERIFGYWPPSTTDQESSVSEANT